MGSISLPRLAVDHIGNDCGGSSILARHFRAADSVSIGTYFFDNLRSEFGKRAALDVDGVCHRLKVIWVDAHLVFAQMVNLHAFRDWTDHLFVHPSMSANTLAVTNNHSILSAFRSSYCTLPNPTTRIGVNKIHGSTRVLMSIDESTRPVFPNERGKCLATTALAIAFRNSLARCQVRHLSRIRITTVSIPYRTGSCSGQR